MKKYMGTVLFILIAGYVYQNRATILGVYDPKDYQFFNTIFSLENIPSFVKASLPEALKNAFDQQAVESNALSVSSSSDVWRMNGVHAANNTYNIVFHPDVSAWRGDDADFNVNLLGGLFAPDGVRAAGKWTIPFNTFASVNINKHDTIYYSPNNARFVLDPARKIASFWTALLSQTKKQAKIVFNLIITDEQLADLIPASQDHMHMLASLAALESHVSGADKATLQNAIATIQQLAGIVPSHERGENPHIAEVLAWARNEGATPAQQNEIRKQAVELESELGEITAHMIADSALEQLKQGGAYYLANVPEYMRLTGRQYRSSAPHGNQFEHQIAGLAHRLYHLLSFNQLHGTCGYHALANAHAIARQIAEGSVPTADRTQDYAQELFDTFQKDHAEALRECARLTDEDILAILRMADGKKVALRSAIQDADKPNLFVLANGVNPQDIADALKTNNETYFLIQSANHFTLLAVVKKPDGLYDLYYLDSLNNPDIPDRIAAMIKAVDSSLGTGKLSPQFLQFLQQQHERHTVLGLKGHQQYQVERDEQVARQLQEQEERQAQQELEASQALARELQKREEEQRVQEEQDKELARKLQEETE